MHPAKGRHTVEMNQQLIAQGSSFDPNWLLSTTAQATAALVGIIGGFLISRLISIVAEKSQQIQSLAELRNRDRVKDAELMKFQKTVSDRTQRWFLEENIQSILEDEGNTNYTKMVDAFNKLGSERQDIAQYANVLKGVVTRAFKELNKVYKFPAEVPQSASEMRADGVRIDSPHDEEIFEKVALHISSTRVSTRVNSHDGLHMKGKDEVSTIVTSSESDQRSPDFVYERHDAAIKERDRLNEELSVIHGEIDLIESHLPAMAQTRRLLQGFVILAYFSLVGIVYPLYLMTRNPVVASASDRTMVLAGFISGLIALLIFIWKSLLDLQGIEKHLARAQKER